jgi:hypothetical protein
VRTAKFRAVLCGSGVGAESSKSLLSIAIVQHSLALSRTPHDTKKVYKHVFMRYLESIIQTIQVLTLEYIIVSVSVYNINCYQP